MTDPLDGFRAPLDDGLSREERIVRDRERAINALHEEDRSIDELAGHLAWAADIGRAFVEGISSKDENYQVGKVIFAGAMRRISEWLALAVDKRDLSDPEVRKGFTLVVGLVDMMQEVTQMIQRGDQAEQIVQHRREEG